MCVSVTLSPGIMVKFLEVVVRNKAVCRDFRGCLVKVLKDLESIEIFRFVA